MRRIFCTICIALLAFKATPVVAQVLPDVAAPQSTFEHILNFSSNIAVNQDGSMDVVETIQVYAAGDKIKHGIYRDFPTTYIDAYGNRVRVAFDISSVKRNNKPEAYRVTNLPNGKRVYLGNANTLLEPGEYTYVLGYHTDRQVGFFKNEDELYWNVTGNGWDFVIDQASALINLPRNIDPVTVKLEGYTGPQGSRQKNFTTQKEQDGYSFATTRALGPKEGLTVVVGWPKGFVHEPTSWERLQFFAKDNFGIILSLLLICLLFTYYFWAWKRVGRDGDRGVIIPEYEAPEALSPAALRYIHNMGFDNTAYTAAILSLAQKGFIHIHDTANKYTLEQKKKSEESLPIEEQKVLENLFREANTLLLDNSNEKFIAPAQTDARKSLELTYKDRYFVLNNGYRTFGILCSVAIILAGFFFIPIENRGVVAYMTGILSIWAVVLTVNIKNAWETRRGLEKLGFGKVILSCLLVLVKICLVIILVLFGSPAYAIFLLLLLTINAVFLSILPRRTPEGQKLKDRIDGFKLFLSVTEQDRMNFHNPPTQTPELFEKFLPYALALGVEQKWAEQFNAMFQRLGYKDSSGYVPLWYTGSRFSDHNISSFSSSLSSAIVSASTPPGSSSGFSGGGGGFSGGGGGGGGGGGW